MTTSSIHIQNRVSLDFTHEDLRPMSKAEFQAVVTMLAAALVLYVTIMSVFVP
ncbi:MAG: hypothetical protein AABY75_04930 [Bacteroidota bacterium]